METVENQKLDICTYYAGLSKGERGRLMLYLAAKYGMRTSTTSLKLRGRRPFSLAEQQVVQEVIDKKLWVS